MPRGDRSTRRFGGKVFEFLGASSTKTRMKERAKAFKESRARNGRPVNVRTIKISSDQWESYWRPAPKKRRR